MLSRFLFIPFLLIIAACAPQVPEGKHIFQQSELRPLLTLVSGDADMRKTLQQCPADVYNTLKTNATDPGNCKKNFRECFQACKLGSAEACFKLARVIEKSDVTQGRSNYTYPLFSASCKAGLANGCVNAAATVKNGNWIAEKPTLPATAECQYKTYRSACDENAVWGCRMVSREYLRRDGFVPYNKRKADIARKKAETLR